MFGRQQQPYPSMTPQEMVAYAQSKGVQTPDAIVNALTPQLAPQQAQPQQQYGVMQGLQTLLNSPSEALFGRVAPAGYMSQETAPFADLRNSLINNPQSLGYQPSSLNTINTVGGQKVAEGMLQGLNFGIPEIAQNIEQYNMGAGRNNPISIPQTQEEVGQAQRGLLNPKFEANLNVSPRTGGLLQDLASGYRENRNTPFEIQNLEPNQDKGIATRIGEGLGSIARFGSSPLGRGLLTAGIVGATGGDGLEALTYGAGAGLVNQQLKTQDQFYRQQLESEGADTSGIGGFITPEMYKLKSLASYRTGMLGLGNKKLTFNDYKTAGSRLDKLLATGSITPDEYNVDIELLNKKFQDDNIKGLLSPNAGISNQTYNTRVNTPKAISAALGNLGVRQAELSLDIPYKQAQTEKITRELNLGGKQLPVNAVENINENISRLNQIEGAIEAAKINPNATGLLQGVTPQPILNRIHPSGTGTRAEYANLSSMIIKDRSGAAVTASEFPRLKPFLPQPTDDARTIQNKLKNFKRIVQEENNSYLNTLQQSGYGVPQGLYNNQPSVQPRRTSQPQSQNYTQVGKYKVRVK